MKQVLFKSKSAQGGLTMIEVLVALLVLSIGLAGIAVLHINSIKFAHSSYYASIVSSAALDLEERLWVVLGSNTDSCVTAAQVATVIDDIEAQWGGTGQGQIVIPGLEVLPGTVSVGTAENTWTEVPLTFRWTDGRFDVQETFDYTARVICYNPPPEDDDD